jgi:hypothetical protein
MGTVRAGVRIDGPIFNAEELWYDLDRWPSFMDGFAHVAKVGPEWPRHGSLTWDSHPGGRERVIEDVLWFSPRVGQDVAVEDPKLTGTQRLRFPPGWVTLELEYRLKESMWLVDLLIVRNRLRESLDRTLRRFAIELRSDAELVDS